MLPLQTEIGFTEKQPVRDNTNDIEKNNDRLLIFLFKTTSFINILITLCL